MLESKSRQLTPPYLPVRLLKIEVDGDFWKDRTKPKIRLTGRWLERAGVQSGHSRSGHMRAPDCP